MMIYGDVNFCNKLKFCVSDFIKTISEDEDEDYVSNVISKCPNILKTYIKEKNINFDDSKILNNYFDVEEEKEDDEKI